MKVKKKIKSIENDIEYLQWRTRVHDEEVSCLNIRINELYEKLNKLEEQKVEKS